MNFKIGHWVKTNKEVYNFFHYIGEGTKVEIIGISAKGYDLRTEDGIVVKETGFNSVIRDNEKPRRYYA